MVEDTIDEDDEAIIQDEFEAGPPSRTMRIRSVPAVTRAVAILRMLSNSDHPLGVKAISDKLNMVPSTCLHILRALVAEELVIVDLQTKRYTLGLGVLSLARKLLREDNPLRALQPELTKLAIKYDVTITIVRINDDRHSVVVGVTYSDRPLRLNVEIGSRFPTLVSATGRCYAAFGSLSDKRLANIFKELRWYKAPRFQDWKNDILEAKREGYAVDRGNYIADGLVVSIPVFDHYGVMTHSIAAIGPISETGPRQIELANALKEAVKRVS